MSEGIVLLNIYGLFEVTPVPTDFTVYTSAQLFSILFQLCPASGPEVEELSLQETGAHCVLTLSKSVPRNKRLPIYFRVTCWESRPCVRKAPKTAVQEKPRKTKAKKTKVASDGSHLKKTRRPRLKTEFPIVCSFCGQAFQKLRSLRLHEHHHKGTYPNMCSVCHKGFMDRDAFKNHMLTHEGKPPVNLCDILRTCMHFSAGAEETSSHHA